MATFVCYVSVAEVLANNPTAVRHIEKSPAVKGANTPDLCKEPEPIVGLLLSASRLGTTSLSFLSVMLRIP